MAKQYMPPGPPLTKRERRARRRYWRRALRRSWDLQDTSATIEGTVLVVFMLCLAFLFANELFGWVVW